MPFQSAVRRYNAPGVKGGWASANPHASLLQSNNGDLGETASPIAIWMVGAAGVIVGQFAFADTVTGQVTSAAPAGVITSPTVAGTVRVGFVQRDQFALITPYMAGAGVTLFQGQPVTLLAAGDVWAEFAAGAAQGQFDEGRALGQARQPGLDRGQGGALDRRRAPAVRRQAEHDVVAAQHSGDCQLRLYVAMLTSSTA